MRTPQPGLALLFLLTAGCTGAPPIDTPLPDGDAPGTYRLSFAHDDLTRTAVVHVPDSYDPTAPAALVLNFHGFGGTSEDHLAWADMRALSDRDGVLVAYPQGSLLDGAPHWNAALPSPDNKSTADDLGFARALVDRIDASYPLDRARVSAIGYSNGGMMAFALACHDSDLVAATGSVSGGMLDSTLAECAPTHPTSVIVLHGTADGVLSYQGGDGMAAVADTLAYWVDHNGITADPTSQTDRDQGTTIEHVAYEGGQGGAAVHHYRYEGGEHVWFEESFQDRDATALAWDFLTGFNTAGAL